MDPYRGELVRVEPCAVVPEAERPPRGGRVRAWSDGTTEVRIRQDLFSRVFAFVWLAGAIGSVAALPVLLGAAIFFACVCTIMAIAVFKFGEHIIVTPAAVSIRRRLRRRVFARVDVRRIDVARGRRGWHVAIDDGANVIAIGDGFLHPDATLQWIAQRLRRALEAAR